jgi:hypothetical protein
VAVADSWYLQALALAKVLARDERRYWGAGLTDALAALMVLLELEVEAEAEGQHWAGEPVAE